MSYVDPPAPRPLQPGETPPAPSSSDLLTPGGQATTWVFNPEYQRLVDLWFQVLPLMEQLTTSLDKPYQMARSTDVWDAPVAKRYIQDMGEWRNRLGLYRQAVLTAISDQAADTPRWIPSKAGAPHAYS
ncbi:hypothetical protein Aph01nite_54160 [Acrocarpospora phusangensis]|uniref:Uncharacterized protein n=1 Tax=Acrocarpospora phusangensis TaxID=1070424 RepID=A0A919UMA2_9ACTN|nr:hypothetical protein [Acrocarpospora phusangensis]GIH27106.1 hypothetical protein Aph01nite_54160 [Acrocarpospora phusangensis]